MVHASFPVAWCRQQFPAFQRTVAGHPAAFFDGPGGSQCPQRVIDAVCRYLSDTNANRGGRYITAQESDELIESAHGTLASFVGSSDPQTIVFGANMTSLTFALSRALSANWTADDEIVVTRLDHDGNVTPWVLAARDAGATVRYVDFDSASGTLDLDEFEAQLSRRTRLVAVGCASNIIGTLNPVAEICRRAHAVGAQCFLDAVHYAPHALPDVVAWDCDWMACSAYKFFGPHVGLLWGRRALLEELTPYKLRPVTESLPGRWMTGTQNFEGIAGAQAAVAYLAELGRQSGSTASDLRSQLRDAYQAIRVYEEDLMGELLRGLLEIEGLKVLGITDPARFAERTATVSVVSRRHRPIEIAETLGKQGLFVGHGNFYALQFTERLGLEPDGVLRIGLLHYNTREEVARLLTALRGL